MSIYPWGPQSPSVEFFASSWSNINVARLGLRRGVHYFTEISLTICQAPSKYFVCLKNSCINLGLVDAILFWDLSWSSTYLRKLSVTTLTKTNISFRPHIKENMMLVALPPKIILYYLIHVCILYLSLR